MKSLCFLTDFGLEDAYVGVLHGVAAGISPTLRTFDICHEIQPQNIKSAAYVLKTAYRYFPSGSVFLSIVDPGVGTQRRLIAVKVRGRIFVAPDNGLLPAALAREKSLRYREILWRPKKGNGVSATFHGRDLMTPIAVHLACGKLRFSQVGPACTNPVSFAESLCTSKADRVIQGEIIHRDHFGNAITNIDRNLLPKLNKMKLSVYFKARKIPWVRTYGEAGQSQKMTALWNSENHLEFALRNGSAWTASKMKQGEKVTLR